MPRGCGVIAWSSTPPKRSAGSMSRGGIDRSSRVRREAESSLMTGSWARRAAGNSAADRRRIADVSRVRWMPALLSSEPEYPLCIIPMRSAGSAERSRSRWPVSTVQNRLAGDRPVPDLVTEVPGPKARAHVAYDETWTSPSLPRAYPIVPVRGDGLTVEDIDGNLFLDFAAGIAVTSTGHAHPQVVGAIKEQAGDLLHFSASDFYLPIYAETCQRIAEITPIARGRARAYLGNSGAEMVEASIKLARHATKRPYVVAFLGAFHGRTYGAVSLTASKAKYHAGFGPLLPGVFHAPFGKVEDLR